MENRIQIIYERDPNYKSFLVTQLWGGWASGGLNLELIEDRVSTPVSSSISVADKSEEFVRPENSIRRVVQAGITISPENLPSFIKFLQDKLQEHLDRLGQSQS